MAPEAVHRHDHAIPEPGAHIACGDHGRHAELPQQIGPVTRGATLLGDDRDGITQAHGEIVRESTHHYHGTDGYERGVRISEEDTPRTDLRARADAVHEHRLLGDLREELLFVARREHERSRLENPEAPVAVHPLHVLRRFEQLRRTQPPARQLGHVPVTQVALGHARRWPGGRLFCRTPPGPRVDATRLADESHGLVGRIVDVPLGRDLAGDDVLTGTARGLHDHARHVRVDRIAREDEPRAVGWDHALDDHRHGQVVGPQAVRTQVAQKSGPPR